MYVRRIDLFGSTGCGQRVPAHGVPVASDVVHAEGVAAIAQAVDHTAAHRQIARALLVQQGARPADWRIVEATGVGFSTSARVKDSISLTHALERLVASSTRPHTLTSREAFQAASRRAARPAAILRVLQLDPSQHPAFRRDR